MRSLSKTSSFNSKSSNTLPTLLSPKEEDGSITSPDYTSTRNLTEGETKSNDRIGSRKK